MTINELWKSKKEEDWNGFLNNYWDLIKTTNLELEKRMDNLDYKLVEKMELDEFYEFMIEDYFQWKFTDSRWLKRNREYFSRYVSEEKLDKLSEIKEKLFSFSLNDIEKGLRITSSINGLGVAGGSGLLALLFPTYFGTVDQFVVKSLILLDGYKDNIDLIKMKGKADKGRALNIKDGVILIEIMRRKADDLNRLFKSNKWTCRDIDKILWTWRDSKNKSTNTIYNKQESVINIEKDYKINIDDKMDLVNLKNNFEIYLRNMGRKEARIKEDLSWAFVHYNNDIGIDFWESFKSEEKIKMCQEALYNVAINGGLTGRGVKDPRGYAAGYMSSIKRLKRFFDEEYGSVDRYMKIHDLL